MVNNIFHTDIFIFIYSSITQSSFLCIILFNINLNRDDINTQYLFLLINYFFFFGHYNKFDKIKIVCLYLVIVIDNKNKYLLSGTNGTTSQPGQNCGNLTSLSPDEILVTAPSWAAVNKHLKWIFPLHSYGFACLFFVLSFYTLFSILNLR